MPVTAEAYLRTEQCRGTVGFLLTQTEGGWRGGWRDEWRSGERMRAMWRAGEEERQTTGAPGWEAGGGGTGMFERDHEVGHAVRHTVRRREAAPL